MLERRAFHLEVRAGESDRTISGYAALFNKTSDGLRFKERLAPGAFADSIGDKAHDIFGYWNHDSNIVLASRNSDTLRLTEDDKGLMFSMVLDDDPLSEHAYRAVKGGKVRKMSFGFKVQKDDWALVDGTETRTLTKVDLYEISPVSRPAYSDTYVEARAAQEVWDKHLAEGGAATESKDERYNPLEVLIRLNQHRNRCMKQGDRR